MEQVIIQDCGCIALPESVATALDLRRGMTLDVALTENRDAVVITPHRADPTSTEDASSQHAPASSCVILPPSR
jgi:antitoxin component of MazEF toxin-antitoxin module